MDSKNKAIAGIVMAAGKGSRMAPLTNQTPKPLAKIQGKTLLEINMVKIAPLVDYFVIVIHYLGQQIVEYIGNEFDGKPVFYIDSQSPVTGSLGAFRFGFYAQERTAIYDDVVLINSDNILDDEFYRLFKNQIMINRQISCYMAYPEPDHTKLLSQGVFVVDDSSHLVRVAEKSPVFVSDLCNVGLYYFPNKVKEFLTLRCPSPNGEELITDLMTRYIQKYPVKILSCDSYYYPLSTVEDLTKAKI
jgi:UDP-N-acetylglucosamine diphosphorylase / glucose-1-phosphate thymidylyltransferase / UDP-N-acetylgalactosamine diphosphorylase / glucosamine-1-phosphate N-acetyltransferase / galactosamine-1-phosphate N-acetyltransferase